MEFDAFDAGVAIGGLRTKNDIKTLICYLVMKLDRPVKKSTITDVLQQEGIANYFDVSQSLTELIETRNLICDYNDEAQELIRITPLGRENAINLQRDIPLSIRQKALGAVVKFQTVERCLENIDFKIEEIENGYNVTLIMFDNEEELLKLTFYVADYEQALCVKDNFLSDPAKIYSGIISLLSV